MSTISRQISVSCPPERVFAVLQDVARLAEFSHMTIAMRNAPAGKLEKGDKFEQTIKVLGVVFDTEWVVTELVEASTLRFEGTSKANGRASMTQLVMSEGQGSRVEFEVEYDPPLGIIGDIVDKVLFERQHVEAAEQILSRLKYVCENVPAR